MRSEADCVADLVDAAQAITDRLVRHTLASFAASPDAIKATFHDVAAIVAANPDIPWVDWIRLGDIVTHQYYRLAPEIIWRDYEAGEIGRLLECGKGWLAQVAVNQGRDAPPPARGR